MSQIYQPPVIRSGSALGYAWGQCAAWVASITAWAGSNWGSAYQWVSRAAAQGFNISGSAQQDSIAVWQPGQGGAGSSGHVAKVVGFSSGHAVVSEENWNNQLGIPDLRVLTSAEQSSAQYILPPSNQSSSVSNAAQAIGVGVSTTGPGTGSGGNGLAQFGTGFLIVVLAIGLIVIGLVVMVRKNAHPS